jgi:hypothetical protein
LTGYRWLNEIKFNKYNSLDDDNYLVVDNTKTSSQDDKRILAFADADCLILAINSQRHYFTVFNFKSNYTEASYSNIKKKPRRRVSIHSEEYENGSNDSNVDESDDDDSESDNESEELMETCLGFDDSSANLFKFELSNWLDKLTEGLGSEKHYVKEWPQFN